MPATGLRETHNRFIDRIVAWLPQDVLALAARIGIGAIFLYLVRHGAGRVSLDHLLGLR